MMMAGKYSNDSDRLLTKREIAQFIGQTSRSVENLMKRGMPHLKLSPRATRFRLTDIQQWLNEHCRVVRG
jgi:predicted DNA-binding transcriptional regulator AlpA